MQCFQKATEKSFRVRRRGHIRPPQRDAGTQLVRWVADPDVENGGDWKVVEGSTTDLENLVAQGQPKAVAPKTKEFEAEGWLMIDPTGGTSAEAGDGAGESS